MIKSIDLSPTKYLCKCIDNKDHLSYRGSGIYWRRILKAHPGYTLATEVLGYYETNEELRKAGLFHSNLHNVVESKDWANLMPEMGDGGSTTKGRVRAYNPSTKESGIFKTLAEIPQEWLRGQPKRGPKDPSITRKVAAFHRGRIRSEETRQRMRNSIRRQRLTIPCSYCNRAITKQNLERHIKSRHPDTLTLS